MLAAHLVDFDLVYFSHPHRSYRKRNPIFFYIFPLFHFCFQPDASFYNENQVINLPEVYAERMDSWVKQICSFSNWITIEREQSWALSLSLTLSLSWTIKKACKMSFIVTLMGAIDEGNDVNSRKIYSNICVNAFGRKTKLDSIAMMWDPIVPFVCIFSFKISFITVAAFVLVQIEWHDFFLSYCISVYHFIDVYWSHGI